MNNYLMVNDIFRYSDNGNMERILWINDKYTSCYTIDLTVNDLIMYQRSTDELTKLLLEGNISIETEDPFFRLVQEEDITEHSIEQRDRALEIVEFVINDAKEPDIYRKRNRRRSILKAVEEFNIGEKTIYKHLKKYLKAGRVKNSLLPDTMFKSGGPGKKRSSLVKLGRPRNASYITGENEGINVNDQIRKIFEIAVARYHFKREKRSLAETFRLMKDDFFSETVIEDGNQIQKTLPNAKKPTFGQFKYWFYNAREKNIVKEFIAREGEKAFLNNYKGLTSSSAMEAIGPGTIFQIDSTVADVYLVNRYDRKSIIGRPVVYIAADVFSRVIAALHIALEGPNWNGVSSLIYNCMEGKDDFCKKYGFDINKDDWPIRGLPSSFLADRGETIGPIATKVISDLGIEIANTPSYVASAKGLVEQCFNTINISIKHWTPGAIKKDFRERGERDYRLDAKYDIAQFTELIVYAIIKHNKGVLEEYSLSKEMVADGVRPIPLDLWNWGIRNKSGALRKIPEDILKLNLMRTDKALVTKEGIEFQGKLYTSERAIKEQWFAEASIQSSWYVDICYDNRDITYIYIINKKDSSFESCTLREDHLELYRGLSYEEFEDKLFMDQVSASELTDYDDQVNLDYTERAKRLRKKVEEQDTGEKKSTKNIRENRKEEGASFGVEQALRIGENSSIKSTKDTYKPDDIEDDDSKSIILKKLLKLRKEEQ